MPRMRIYLAGPLFTLAERTFNQQLVHEMQARHGALEIILPQDFAPTIAEIPDFPQRMFRYSLESIDGCDGVVAILDGADADSGTCIEIGYARARGKPVIGVRTDLRASEDRGLNLMVANTCSRLILASSTSTSVEALSDEIITALTTALSLGKKVH